MNSMRRWVGIAVVAMTGSWASTDIAHAARGPYLQRGTPTGISVVWEGLPHTCVHYGLSLGDKNLIACATDTTAQPVEVRLTNLTPNTKYYYSLGSPTQAVLGDATHYFMTAPPVGTKKPTRIWVLGDSGRGSGARSVYNSYVAFNGDRHTDLWLMLGDNALSSGTETEFTAKLFNIFPEMLRKSVLWPTPGNHEYGTSNAAPYYRAFLLPTEAEAGGVVSKSEKYYAFNYANIHFISMDSQTKPSGMLDWLKQDLAAVPATQDWIIAFWHHPPYSEGSHYAENGGPMAAYLPALEAAGLDVELSGHSHSYERSFPLDGHEILVMKDGREDGDGAYQPADGPHHGTIYNVAGSSGSTSGGSLTHRVMFVSWNVLGSVVLDINGDRLDSTFLSSTGTVLDHYTVSKAPALPPVAPTNLAATAAPYSATEFPSIAMSWTDNPVTDAAANANETAFVIERREGTTGEFQPVGQASADATSYTDRELNGLTRYFYRVKAINGNLVSAYTNLADATTAQEPPIGPNLVLNPGFEAGTANWAAFDAEEAAGPASQWAGCGTAAEGNNVLHYYDATSTIRSVGQLVNSIVAGRTYRVAVRIKTKDVTGATQRAALAAQWLPGGAKSAVHELSGTAGWQSLSRELAAPAGATSLQLSLELGGFGASPSPGEACFDQIEVRAISGEGVNQQPVANAGMDQNVLLSAGAHLVGVVSDDHLPNPPDRVTTGWSKVSGPGTVTFGNPAALDTTAAFSQAGIYVLRLTASDSLLSASDEIQITVTPEPVNQAPQVSAGPDQTITLPSAANLDGTVSDDGLPNPPARVTTTWSKASGPGTVTFANASAVDTTATFSVAGDYVLRLSASDSVLSASDTVTVTVRSGTDTERPTVRITSPAAGSQVGRSLPVSAAASDNVGVARVELVVDGAPMGSDTTNAYEFVVTLTDGGHTLVAKAYDAAGNMGQSEPVTITVSVVDPTALCPPPAADTVCIPVAADAYVERDASADRGASRILWVDDPGLATENRTFLRFDLSGISGTIAEARLRLKVSTDIVLDGGTDSTHGGLLNGVRETGWSEAGMTWATQPALDGTSLGSLGAVAVGQVVEFKSLQTYLTGRRSVSLALVAGNTNGAGYMSKETGSGAVLVVKMSGGGGDSSLCPAEPGLICLTAAADTYVEKDANLDRGISPVLWVDDPGASTENQAFLRFDLSGVSGAITEARLRLKVSAEPFSDSNHGGHLKGLSSTTWSETGMTWANKPTVDGSALGSLGAVAVGQVVEFANLQGYLSGKSAASVAITPGTTNGVGYMSRETGSGAVLVLRTGTPDTEDPTVRMTAPAAGSVLAETATLAADASDNVGISRVEFYRGVTLLGADTTSPYSHNWDTRSVVNGSYTLLAKAIDLSGRSAASASVAVSVNNIGPVAPNAPSNLSGTKTSLSNVLAWMDNANNESGFRVYRDGAALSTVGINQTTYTDAISAGLPPSGQTEVTARLGPIKFGSEADDPAIWIHPTDPTKSLMILSDKVGGIAAYDFTGRRIQLLSQQQLGGSGSVLKFVNNIDVRTGVQLGGRTVDVVAGNLRTAARLLLLEINPNWTDGNALTILADARGTANAISTDSYGFTLYKRASDGALFVFDKTKSTAPIKQWRIASVNGQITTTLARTINDLSIGVAEGFVADDAAGFVYFAEEGRAIHKYQADPDHPTRTRVGVFATGDGISGQREGLALYGCHDGSGYLVLSSQGNSQFKVYDRQGSNAYLKTFTARSSKGTDGLDVHPAVVPGFPKGFAIIHNDHGASGEPDMSYFVYDWEDIARTGTLQAQVLNVCPNGVPLPPPGGSHAYTVTAFNAVGESAHSNTLTCDETGCTGGPAGVTLSLTATPESVVSGDSSLLRWDALNATSCSAEGGWTTSTATLGSQEVRPTSTRSYAMSCTGPGPSASKSVAVTVIPGPDTIPPTVAITAPGIGAEVASPVLVSVRASDEVGGSGMAKVELYVQGALRGTDTTNDYSFSVNLSEGSYSLVAKAYDAAGNSTSSTPVGVTVVPVDTSDDTFACLAVPGRATTTLPAQTYTAGYMNASIPANQNIDARTAIFYDTPKSVPFDRPVILDGGSNICFAGGRTEGQFACSLTWSAMHDQANNHGGVQMDNAGSTIDGVRVDNVEDGIRVMPAAKGFSIKNAWLTGIRDDCIDDHHNIGGSVDDTLMDGCYVGVSTRNLNGVNGSDQTLSLTSSLIRLEPTASPHSSESTRPAHGALFKTGSANVKLQLHNNVFLVAMNSNSFIGIPTSLVSGCSNNTIVWLGGGAFPDSLGPPGCVTRVTTDINVWHQAVAEWKARHPKLQEGAVKCPRAY